MSDSAQVSPKRRGRRPGVSVSRTEVLNAARARFANEGFDHTTVRAVAADAGVDAALVIRQFGSKEKLFAVAMTIPPRASADLAAAFEGDLAGLGARVVRSYLSVWEDPELSAPLKAMLRSAVSHDEAADHLRRFLEDRMTAAAVHLVAADASSRLALAASQLLGVALARHVLVVGSVAGASVENLVDLLAPSVQSLLAPGHPTTR